MVPFFKLKASAEIIGEGGDCPPLPSLVSPTAYKALNNLAPVYISNLLVRYEPSRNLRSTDKYLLQIPKTRLKTYGDRAFSVSAPRLWNVLPMEIKLSPSDSVFKNRLKTHLFRATYN